MKDVTASGWKRHRAEPPTSGGRREVCAGPLPLRNPEMKSTGIYFHLLAAGQPLFNAPHDRRLEQGAQRFAVT